MLSPLVFGIEAGLSAAAGLGLTAGGCAYAAMWPASRLFGAALIAPRRPGELALTFDDGPNPRWTPPLLATLAQWEVRATFFSMGAYAEAQKQLLRQMADAGHLIGSHAWSHPNLALTRASQIREELQRSKETLEQILGQPVRFFRPPFGGRRPAVFRIARELGLTPVLWNAMTADWKEPSANAIADQLSQRIDQLERRGWAANIVLHDGSHLEPAALREPSVNAAGKLLERYAQTRRFVTLDAAEWNSNFYNQSSGLFCL
jgi:peptidoglycan/xylan/chitin deacetylase (PgdA/CDA1 family)